MTKPLIQISQRGAVVKGSAADWERLREQFAHQHCVRLIQFLEPGLLDMIQQRLAQAGFERFTQDKVFGNDLSIPHASIAHVMEFLLNNPSCFHLLERITGFSRIGCFKGRFYRFVPGQGHHYDWHNDWTDQAGQDRLAAMSINLSTEVYQGGILQIRERGSKQVLHEAANTGFGDAVIFRIAAHLEHRVTEVEGVASKTAFAGWFKSHSDYFAELKAELTQGRAVAP